MKTKPSPNKEESRKNDLMNKFLDETPIKVTLDTYCRVIRSKLGKHGKWIIGDLVYKVYGYEAEIDDTDATNQIMSLIQEYEEGENIKIEKTEHCDGCPDCGRGVCQIRHNSLGPYYHCDGLKSKLGGDK